MYMYIYIPFTCNMCMCMYIYIPFTCNMCMDMLQVVRVHGHVAGTGKDIAKQHAYIHVLVVSALLETCNTSEGSCNTFTLPVY